MPTEVEAACLSGVLTDVAQRGLIRWDGDELVLDEGSQPYARTIAARFDRFRGTIAPADTAAIAR